jgi:CheY-like chemotaxis protein
MNQRGEGMGKRILIIDDEPDMITFLTTLLEDNGYETAACMSAQDGLREAIDNPPDLITLDLLMPDKSGIGLYKELKRREVLRRIPVIIVTGFTSDQHPMVDFRKFIYARSLPGPEGFIEKPVEPSGFLDTVSRILVDQS